MRANYLTLGAPAMTILMAQESHLHEQFARSNKLSVAIWELVKLRVSQINQCAFCIDMHSKDAREGGESDERMLGLSAWRDMPMYSPVERAALGWAERVTYGQRIEDQHFHEVKEILGEQAMVDLTIAVNAINSWNRLVKAFKPEVGSYNKPR